MIIYHVDGYHFPTVSEWLCMWHSGFAGVAARQNWLRRLRPDVPLVIPASVHEAAAIAATRLRAPARVRISPQGEFTKVTPRFEGDQHVQ
jgi:hypothetical protein